jgi:hypothetical protein
VPGCPASQLASQAAYEPLPGSNGQPTATIRHGTTILRPAGPWTPAVHALLRHLEQVGYPASPRVVADRRLPPAAGGSCACSRTATVFRPRSARGG